MSVTLGDKTPNQADKTTVADLRRMMGSGNIAVMRGLSHQNETIALVIYAEDEAAEELTAFLTDTLGFDFIEKPLKPKVKA